MTQDEIIEMWNIVIKYAPSEVRIAEFAKLVAAKAIAELESQEPVALPCCGYKDASAVKWNPLNDVVQCHNCGQTYAHPPQRTWQGLTDDDEILAISNTMPYADRFEFARAIEAKLKEKNT